MLKRLSIILFIAVIIAYLVIPIGAYGTSDVTAAEKTLSKANFRKLVKTEFVAEVKDNNTPSSGYIIYPATAITRDGNNSGKGTLGITDGWIRSGAYRYGDLHGAVDSTMGGSYNKIGSCTHGGGCTDNVLIAPFEGTVSYVYRADSSVYGTNSGPCSWLTVDGTGDWEGFSWEVLHADQMPSNLVEGYTVKQGEFIGAQCAMGYSTGSHVHFAILQNGEKLHVKDWWPKVQLHSSIEGIEVIGGEVYESSLTLEWAGMTRATIEEVNKRERYTSDVVIPDANKYK